MCEDNCNDDSEIVVGPAIATGSATFTDAGAAGLDAGAELTAFTGAGLVNFVDGFVFIQQGKLTAGATFTDAGPAGLDAGAELTLFTGSDLSDFKNGAVTISQSSNPDNPFAWSTAANNLAAKVPVTITEQGPNSGVFGTYDESDTSNLVITTRCKEGNLSINYLQ